MAPRVASAPWQGNPQLCSHKSICSLRVNTRPPFRPPPPRPPPPTTPQQKLHQQHLRKRQPPQQHPLPQIKSLVLKTTLTRVQSQDHKVFHPHSSGHHGTSLKSTESSTSTKKETKRDALVSAHPTNLGDFNHHPTYSNTQTVKISVSSSVS